MDSGEEYILLDVRTDQEFNERHIGGAVLIPDYEIAANELLEMGYLRVYDFGGIIGWPYETTGE